MLAVAEGVGQAMKRFLGGLLLVLAIVAAAAFLLSREPAAERNGAGFDVSAFFSGQSVSAGTIRTALVLEEAFTATFEGRETEAGFRLEERFAFQDGERLQVWTLRPGPVGDLAGTVETERADGTLAAPVPVVGRRDADGVTLDYRGIAPGGGAIVFHFRHTMRAQGDGTVSNHVVVSKFGLPVAVSSVTFAKAPGALSSPARRR